MFLVIRTPEGAKAINLDHVSDIWANDSRITFYGNEPLDDDGEESHGFVLKGDEAKAAINRLGLAPTEKAVIATLTRFDGGDA